MQVGIINSESSHVFVCNWGQTRMGRTSTWPAEGMFCGDYVMFTDVPCYKGKIGGAWWVKYPSRESLLYNWHIVVVIDPEKKQYLL